MNFLKKIFGGASGRQSNIIARKGQADVYRVADEEERMNVAIEKARLTLNYFKQSLIAPRPDQEFFSLKVCIVDGDHAEHIWLDDVSFDSSNIFYGKVGNNPMSVANVSLGQEVGVGSDDVSDWMIAEDGRLIGGYTIRALREGLKGSELKAFDRKVGMYIDEGVDYFEHDQSTPEGAILCLEDAYDARDLDQALACKHFQAEATLLLKKFTFPSDAEMVSKTAEALQLTFIQQLHGEFPSFEGLLRAFPRREYIDEDLCIVTEVCHYPDGGKSEQRLYVSRKDGLWYVLHPAKP